MNGLSESGHRPLILDQMGVLGDLTRTRILLLLERRELTVAEICQVLQAPQSTVSRHLKALGDAGWVTSRSEATSRLYSPTRDAIAGDARRLWQLVRAQVSPAAAALQDGRRLDAVLATRRSRSQEFFSSTAGQWDRVRAELFGRSFHLLALAGLLDTEWTVGDLGCGTGQAAEALAPCVRAVVAIDESAAMLQAARRRLRAHANVELRRGSLEALPLDDASLDAAVCVLVLHHLPEPERALAEAARVLRPGGRLLVVDMLPHDREAYRQQMGHVWLGFSEEQVRSQLTAAGLADVRCRTLDPDPAAQGPALFAASARRVVPATRRTASTERSTVQEEGEKR
jgi:ubiquinone/menaquinone biosynthesis C-methylase UbiE/DNA-binding transcriptional ArsR family regulator